MPTLSQLTSFKYLLIAPILGFAFISEMSTAVTQAQAISMLWWLGGALHYSWDFHEESRTQVAAWTSETHPPALSPVLSQPKWHGTKKKGWFRWLWMAGAQHQLTDTSHGNCWA